MGDAKSGPFRLSFNPQLWGQFRGPRVTSDAGLVLPRELDERVGLSALTAPDTIATSPCRISSASPFTAARLSWRQEVVP